MDRTGMGVHGPIIGLSLACVQQWNGDPLMRSTPRIPTRIIPNEVALIDT
jgi:hypothetical protein